jgi:hypothetical protein
MTDRYFILGRIPGPGDRIVGHIIRRIAGFDYIRYTFADEVGPHFYWLVWADIAMQTQNLAMSPFLQSINRVAD